MDAKREQLNDALQSAQRLAEELQDEISKNTAFRQRLVQTSKSLTHSLQAPVERYWDIHFQPHVLTVAKVASDAGWLEHLSQASTKGATIDGIAKATATDNGLARRLLRLLAAARVVDETGVDTYAPNELTKLITLPPVRAGVTHSAEDYSKTLARMPDYFAEKGYMEPASLPNDIYTYAHGVPIFQLFNEQPHRAAAFNLFMASSREGQKAWTDVYPIETLNAKSKDDVLLIDVGGGLGHILHAFAQKRKALDLPGKLILQDQQQMIDQVPPEWKQDFEARPHDFFKPQPEFCHGARAYYLRTVLHDWPDDACVRIMKHIRDAMKPGVSKLLLNEQVLPNSGCNFITAAMDITMMACLSGKERTEHQWQELIGEVEGLKIEKIWPLAEGSSECIIEIARVT